MLLIWKVLTKKMFLWSDYKWLVLFKCYKNFNFLNFCLTFILNRYSFPPMPNTKLLQHSMNISKYICLSIWGVAATVVHAMTLEEAELCTEWGLSLTGAEVLAEGNIVTSPDTHFGLPDSNYVEVENMTTSGLGSSGEVAEIIGQLQKALDANDDKNDLMHWYVTAGREVLYCTPNSFRCDYVKHKTAVVLGLWMPREAKEITVSFTSQSKQLSLGVYSYDYITGEIFSYTNTNNGFQNSGAPDTVYTYSETFYPGETSSSYSGQYLFLMFNSAESEKTWIDINGLGVTYVPVDPEETPEDNPFQPGVAYPDYFPLVPEPTTSTLSLLALTFLSTRRRRR